MGRGDIALITRPSFSDTFAPWNLERLWANAHVGVVRSVLWDEEVSLNFALCGARY
jgi:WD repeat-containing protein 89